MTAAASQDRCDEICDELLLRALGVGYKREVPFLFRKFRMILTAKMQNDAIYYSKLPPVTNCSRAAVLACIKRRIHNSVTYK